MPVIYLLTASPGFKAKTAVGEFAGVTASIIVSIVISMVFYRHIERRFQNPRGGRIGATNFAFGKLTSFFVAPLILIFSLLVIVSSGYFGVVKNSHITNPGEEFKKQCERVGFAHQFPCFLNTPTGRGLIAVLGDSHASQYALVLKKIAVENNLGLIMVGNIGEGLDSRRTLQLLSDAKPTLTIISKYWKVTDLQIDSEFSKSFNSIQKNGGELLIIGQNPVFLSNTPVQSASLIRKILSEQSLNSDVLHFIQEDEESLRAGDALNDWAFSKTLNLVRPRKILCPQTDCFPLLSSTNLYIDNNHLSSDGADRMHQVLETAVTELVK